MLHIHKNLRQLLSLRSRTLHNCHRNPCVYQRSKRVTQKLERLFPVYQEKRRETVDRCVIVVGCGVGAIMGFNYVLPLTCFMSSVLFFTYVSSAFTHFDELQTLKRQIKQLENIIELEKELENLEKELEELKTMFLYLPLHSSGPGYLATKFSFEKHNSL